MIWERINLSLSTIWWLHAITHDKGKRNKDSRFRSACEELECSRRSSTSTVSRCKQYEYWTSENLAYLEVMQMYDNLLARLAEKDMDLPEASSEKRSICHTCLSPCFYIITLISKLSLLFAHAKVAGSLK